MLDKQFSKIAALKTCCSEKSIKYRSSRSQMFLKISPYSQENVCVGAFFNKVVAQKACSFTKKRLECKCFPVNVAKFLRTGFL